MRFGYFLLCTHEPKHRTLTWTLDYRFNSDFDDNVGHWQVMPHPSKAGWTRVLYSTKIKLFPWIPEFIISFLTGKALLEVPIPPNPFLNPPYFFFFRWGRAQAG
jgi:hypothetical protein